MNYATFSPSSTITFVAPPLPPPSPPQPALGAFVWPQHYAVANTIALPVGSSPETCLISCLGPESAYVTVTSAAATTTGTAAVGATALNVASSAGIAAGQAALDNSGAINAGTFVSAVNGTTVTLSQATLAALDGASVYFVVPASEQNGVLVVPRQPPLGLAYVTSGFISAVCVNGGSSAKINCVVGV